MRGNLEERVLPKPTSCWKGQRPVDRAGLKAAWAGPGEETVQRERRADKWLLLEVGQQGEARANAQGAARPAGVESRHSFPG